MKFDFLENEIDILIELAFLGNWIANAARLPGKRIVKYEKLFDKIINQAETETGIKINQEDLYDRTERIIKQFETDVFPSVFSKLYADYLFPNKKNSEFIEKYISHKIVRDFCEKEFRSRGFKNISIELPDLSEDIKKKINSLKID